MSRKGPRRPGWARQVLLVAKKDLLIEVATGEIVTTAGFFAVLVAVISSLSFFAGKDSMRDVAPGVIWVSIAFASVLALSRTWQRERDENAIRGLLVAPLSRSAIFVGKALGVGAFVTVVELIVVPVTAVLFRIDLTTFGPLLMALLTSNVSSRSFSFPKRTTCLPMPTSLLPISMNRSSGHCFAVP